MYIYIPLCEGLRKNTPSELIAPQNARAKNALSHMENPNFLFLPGKGSSAVPQTTTLRKKVGQG